ncbi:MAG TPA: hypothetical protein VEL82_02720 [Thermoplasmata archaeon]|nr:hypothetical protein [Thermoplasmata archaeon]
MPGAPARPPAEVLARFVLERILCLRRGETLTVEAWSHGVPWARALIVAARRRGATATLVVEDEPAFFEGLATRGARSPRPFAARPSRSDALVRLEGPEAFPRLFGIDRDRIDRMLGPAAPDARDPSRGRPRSVRLRVADASAIAAARFGLDAERWEAELYRASLVDPRRLVAAGRRLTRSLGRSRSLRLRHPNGTDLSLRLSAAPPRIWSGRASADTPGDLPGGLWTARISAGSASGVWETNRPAYDRWARTPVVTRARLRFVAGRLREFDCESGEEALAAFVRSGRGRVRPLRLAIGLNPEIDRAPEVGELGDGVASLWVGARPPASTGGGPRFSFVASLSGAEIERDGRTWPVARLVAGPPARR